MNPSAPSPIPHYIECSYYDRRTDYIWQYLKGSQKHVLDEYRIPGPESFLAMSEMLRSRKLSVAAFMHQWQHTPHPTLLECTYSERSGILRLKSRTFSFVHCTRTCEYHYVVRADVAKYVRLRKRETHRQYKRGGLFPLAHLSELDEQLFSRYDAARKLQAWKQSPQRQTDIAYCRSMLPYLNQKAAAHQPALLWGYESRLNIILEGNDRVRIGFVEEHTPEEMRALPSYLRADWQLGIDRALDHLQAEYDQEVEQKRAEMTALGQELQQVILGHTPIDPARLQSRFTPSRNDGDTYYEYILLHEALDLGPITRPWVDVQAWIQDNSYLIFYDERPKQVESLETRTFIFVADRKRGLATLTLKDEALAKTLNIDVTSQLNLDRDLPITDNILHELDDHLVWSLQQYQSAQQKRLQPQHQQLVEALKHIMQVTAPLIAYAGTNPTLQTEYDISWRLSDSDQIEVSFRFDHERSSQTFSLDDYRSRFRVWWSQLLLRECKRVKEGTLHPEENLPSDLPF